MQISLCCQISSDKDLYLYSFIVKIMLHDIRMFRFSIQEIKMKRLLVITADDFGFSTERNKGVMEAFNNGAVKSASLLLNCTGTVSGVESARNTGLTLGMVDVSFFF